VTRKRNHDPSNWRLYFITDEQLSHGRTHMEVAKAAIQGARMSFSCGIRQPQAANYTKMPMAIRKLTLEEKIPLIINDRLDIALAVEADGLHVGGKDLPAGIARRILGQYAILGISAESLEEAAYAELAGADYLGVGPIFEAKSTKPDAANPVGLELLSQIRQKTRLPIIAIGGIHHENVRDVVRAGADGIAVISAIVPHRTSAKRHTNSKKLS